jgi:RNase H-fold protein (predicted Holliday junction resolvase)
VNAGQPVLGVDPGTKKCGLAVVVGRQTTPLALEIVQFADFADRIGVLVAGYGVRAIALGSGTHTAVVAACLAGLGVPLTVIDERDTTLLARARYFAAHPPRGWRRLIPRGMLLPPRPIDDFAALLIAERFLELEDGRGG